MRENLKPQKELWGPQEAGRAYPHLQGISSSEQSIAQLQAYEFVVQGTPRPAFPKSKSLPNFFLIFLLAGG